MYRASLCLQCVLEGSSRLAGEVVRHRWADVRFALEDVRSKLDMVRSERGCGRMKSNVLRHVAHRFGHAWNRFKRGADASRTAVRWLIMVSPPKFWTMILMVPTP